MHARMTQQIEELAHRAADGIEVSLFWHETDGDLTVICADTRTGDWFALDADAENALDVYHHPFAYAARRGIAYSTSESGPTSGAALAA